MKHRALSLLLALVLICTLLPAAALPVRAENNGACGENLQWLFNPDSGHLTIQGPGPMDDWPDLEECPWNDFRSDIKSVHMWYGATSIGYAAFEGCVNLREVTIADSVERIESFAFSGCVSLENITIPNGVKVLGGRAFFDTALTAVTIPNSVTSIGDYTFASTDLTGVTIPAGVTQIGEAAFAECESLRKITVSSSNQAFSNDSKGVLYSKDKTRLLQAPAAMSGSYAIAAGTKTVSVNAFDGCWYLSSVSIPDTVTRIDDYAFTDCPSLTSVTVPASVTVIGFKSFGYYHNDYDYVGVPGFHMSGAAGSEAQSYADRERIPFTALAKPKVTSQPKSATVALGSTTTFKVTASGSGLKYQWQFRKAGTSTWYDWAGKTSASLPVTGSTTNNQCQYRCVVSNGVGHVNSAAVTLTVTGSVAKPTITANPAAAKVTLGTTVSFKVTASGTGLSYQWYFSKDNGATWSGWSGKTAATLSVKASNTNNGCLYRCKVSNSAGSVTSSSARLTVSNIKPTIVVQPVNVTTALGKTTTMKVVAAGSGLTYQWQFSKNGGATWSNWSGKTAYKLEITGSATNNGCLYRCVVKNSYGTVTSAVAKLTVT